MRPSLVRTMSAWGRRYLCHGAILGLMVGCLMAPTIFGLVRNLILGPTAGAMLGLVYGGIGGMATHLWESRHGRKTTTPEV